MEDIEQLKSVFRSLVVSSPTQVDVSSLLRDYRNMIGKPVPLAKYGHRDPVEFLKQRFSDCFLFSGQAKNPVLTLIVPNTLKHIDKFVQKQRTPSSTRFNPKRRSVPEELVNPNNLITKTFIERSNPLPSIQEPNKSDIKAPSTLTKEASNSFITQNKYSIGSNVSSATSSTPSTCSSKAGITPHRHNGNVCTPQDVNLPHNNKVVNNKKYCDSDKNNAPRDNNNAPRDNNNAPSDNNNAVKNFFKKRLPLYDSSQDLKESYEKYCQTVQDDDSGRHSCSSGHSAKALQLEQLKSEILALVTEAPEGCVWCTDLIRLYRERYNRELNFSRFGYTSIISLVYCLENEVQITRPAHTGDWLLQERARARAPPTGGGAGGRPDPRPPRAVAHRPRATLVEQPDPDDALPGIDYDPDVFPADCMHFMESIEQVSLSDFRPGAMVEVMIGEVYSPSHFWFIRLGDNYNIAMEDMMDEMTHYYNGEGRNRILARGAVRVGHYCASMYERDWHRSLIVKIVDSDTVKVRHVDYGTVDTLGVGALRPLRREWARLPAQGARARLAGVRPSGAGVRWPRAACTALLRLVSNRRLFANVVAMDQRDAVVEMLLIDTTGADDVCVGSELVRAGHADPRPDSALRTLDVYLYPRFEALESGDTPNYAEIHAYLRDGIALDYVEAYRAHVPAVLPDTPPPAAPAPPPPDPPATAPPAPAAPAPASPASASPPTALTSAQSAPSEVMFHSQPESERSLDSGESKSVSELATRIPLYLPDPSNSAPSLCQLESEPETAPTEPREQPCSTNLSPLAPAYVPGAPYPSRQMYRAPQLGGPRLPAPQLGGPRLPAPQLGGPRLPEPQLGGPRLPAPQLGGPRLPAPQLDGPRLPEPQLGGPRLPAPQLGGPRLPAPQLGGPGLPAPRLPPPYGGVPLPPPGLTLSLEECETFRVLSRVNPAAAQWFMIGTMGRAVAVPVFPTHPSMHPTFRIRPPPGFGT